MTLGDINRTRRLAGNPSTTNVTDSDITQGLNFGTSTVMRITGKTDWEASTTHVSYYTAVMATEYLASGMVRDRFNDQIQISDEHINRGKELCEQIADSLASTTLITSAGNAVAKGKYRSYPLNPNASPYRSMLPTGQTLTGVGSYDIP